MSEKRISFRDEIKLKNQQQKEELAMQDFKRNVWGLDISAIVFLVVILMTLSGIRVGGNLFIKKIIIKTTPNIIIIPWIKSERAVAK